MNRQKKLHQVIGVMLGVLLLVGCGAPSATPVSEAPAATSTTVQKVLATEPPTSTPVPSPSVPITQTHEPPTPTSVPPTQTPVPELAISSLAFEPNGEIPENHSCLGDNLSPALEWSGVPVEAQSLVLLVYDLDAGAESGASTSLGFAHWIVYNIPPSTVGYPENMPPGDSLEDGALQGNNDFIQFETEGATFPGGAPIKLIGYDGPCPGGKHRYSFTIFALDTFLNLPSEATIAQVLDAIEGHILTQAEVVGSYAPSQ
jgi:Raf kinase inhibitor-like YbhB/YbcL family protein